MSGRVHEPSRESPRFWRSLEELTGDEEFLRYLRAEFPEPAALLDAGMSRRSFLKLMGASLALAGVNACTRQPTEKIFPYVDQPEQIVPGNPLFYATAFPLGATALGVLAESHLGRPTKLEGNESHPASLGSTDVLAQAAVLELYDPDRSQVITRGDDILPWQSARSAIAEVMKRYAPPSKGDGLRILTEAVGSPTLSARLRALLKRYPQAQWHRWEPVNRDNARRGSDLAFEDVFDVRYRLDAADVIVAIEADFLAWGSGGVRYARDFAAGRRLEGERTSMNRLYAVESSPTITGAKADHRLALAPDAIEQLVARLAAELGMQVRAETLPESLEKWAAALARDLESARGRSLVVAGEYAPPVVHALVHWINDALGNVGKTLEYSAPIESDPVIHADSLAGLVADMRAGRVTTLVIIGGNPAYDAPADLDFAGAADNVATVFRLGLYNDETSHRSHWHLPQAHWLETWGDARAFDGTATIQQPLIAPLYGGTSAHELIFALMGEEASAHDLVRDHWQARGPGGDFDEFWRKAVHDGVVEGTRAPAGNATVRWDLAARIDEIRRAKTSAPDTGDSGIEGEPVAVTFRPDPHVYDGRFANNPWLQELPKPDSKLVWDNAALVAPKLAERLRLRNGDHVEISVGDRRLTAPVWISPGHADEVVTLPLGYGRTHAGRIGTDVGFNAYRLRTTQALWHLPGARIRKTGAHTSFASTQHHFSMEGRELVRSAALADYLARPDFAHHSHHHFDENASMYPEYAYEGYAWGMTVDLNACIGCNACTIACQAENNIPVVGKEMVARGREMHWIRVDRYFEGSIDNPRVHHQPVPCMHCEKAPCEVVCPVNATVHSDEGLNDMVYNRCVGTRYCSNNCPYKVRRFNFLLYNDWNEEPPALQRNPDVSVRSRGVMEKCTYCVQRISHARIQAKKDGRRIRDGEIVTACQQVCPAEAITFGDINDPEARVTRAKAEPRNYGLLAELGTKPRTTYLASVRNPNPAILAIEGEGEGEPEAGTEEHA